MKVFIPRDAGFFSVFNFLIGSIHNGDRVYPYFNREVFLRVNGVNEHFAYWSNSQNSWFDYFKPIRYNDNDENHINIANLNPPITQGCECGREFRIPEDTKRLLKDKKRYNIWRQSVNQTYNKYIRFSESIESASRQALIYDTEYIGIHYRHPSHFIESGRVYLQQYFDQIDQIDTETGTKRPIFLASDNKFGIAAFKDRYGSRINYLTYVERVDFDGFLEWAFALGQNKADHVGFIAGKGYELHHKQSQNLDFDKMRKATEDLLIEVRTISRCQYLIHTLSNISTAISYMNPSIEMRTIEGIL